MLVYFMVAHCSEHGNSLNEKFGGTLSSLSGAKIEPEHSSSILHKKELKYLQYKKDDVTAVPMLTYNSLE
jgi:hypothetical protein